MDFRLLGIGKYSYLFGKRLQNQKGQVNKINIKMSQHTEYSDK